MKSFILIAGPCVIESKELLEETAGVLSEIAKELDARFFFKSSYKKANRTSADSFMGIGDELALNYLNEIGKKINYPTLTDIHSTLEAEFAAQYVEALQIPAFLCRQTEIIEAAAKTGKIVNIKKGQFLDPYSMRGALDKALQAGASETWLTERGSSFGYNDLVVDYRSLVIMRELGAPVIFDATHSTQKPSVGKTSGGSPQFALPLAKAAAVVGIDGLFIETHPNPSLAKSDASTQLPLKNAKEFIFKIYEIWEKYSA